MAKYKVTAGNLRFKKKRYDVDDEIELTEEQAIALVNKVVPVGGGRAPKKLPPEQIAKAPKQKKGKRKAKK